MAQVTLDLKTLKSASQRQLLKVTIELGLSKQRIHDSEEYRLWQKRLRLISLEL